MTAILPPDEGGIDVEDESAPLTEMEASGFDADASADTEASVDEVEDCTAILPAHVLAAKPPMGWNGWNKFGCSTDLSEAVVTGAADTMASSGMQAAGYKYVNIDDCWQSGRDASGVPIADPVRFPNGIKAVADFVHKKGFNFGMYSSVTACPNGTTSLGYVEQDAATYASWGADFLKYNQCDKAVADPETEFQRMGTALKATGRDIVYSLSLRYLAGWMTTTGQMWRTGPTLQPTWDSITGELDINAPYAAWAHPGGFNDPDMLEVGNGTLTEAENRAHFTLWAIMSAPLIAGNDLSKMTPATAAILTNREVIDNLDQDALGLQGARVRDDGDVEVFAKPLSTCGARGVVLLNRGAAAADVSVAWSEIWLGSGSATVRDMWAKLDRAPAEDKLTVTVQAHDVVALKIVGKEIPRPHGDVFLSDLDWTYATNGFGPVERDTSNGADLAHDGLPMKIGGLSYAKGLGVHGPSLVRYRLGRACTRFTADVGIDDETMGRGSVEFEVWADGEKLADSGIMAPNMAPKTLDIDLTDKSELRLFVAPGSDASNSQDHGDWGNARVQCRP